MWIVTNTETMQTEMINLPRLTPKAIVRKASGVTGEVIVEWRNQKRN